MNWKEELDILEKKKDWESAIILIRRQSIFPDADSYIRVIYFFFNLLLEENFKSKKYSDEVLMNLLYEYFSKSKDKFSDNPEYLFFVGYISSLAEWYFRLDYNTAEGMVKNAYQIEKNILYEWGYHMMNSEKKMTSSVASKILNDPTIIELLNNKGSIGRYFLNMIRSTAERIADK